jgi:formylglycine-generating enzyme required for sulfatase activity
VENPKPTKEARGKADVEGPTATDAAPKELEGLPSAPAGTAQGMVSVGAGPFAMGCNVVVDSECEEDEKAGKTVEVAAFEIDRTEVTVAEYAKCVAAGTCLSAGLSMPFYDGREQAQFAEFCNWPKREHYPLNCVSWDQAVVYCRWAGKRLPTEAEWEKAARGTDGRKYPWGNEGYGAGGKVANIADESAKRRFPDLTIATGYDDGFVGTAPVGSFPAGASPSGALDMIGNVLEWTSDALEGGRAVRGGSFYRGPSLGRASARARGGLTSRDADVGFRCAR